MYVVISTGEAFESFFKAIGAAKIVNSDLYCPKAGRVVWRPAPQITAQKERMYKERMTAYAAQKERDLG
jgi:hypothetical protein